MNVLIVGAGFAGATCARQFADAGHHVTVIDKRPHIAGNAYDHIDTDGVLVHAYGPHIFHTNSEKVFAFLSRFTDWRPYEHRVLASVDGQWLPIPINRTTLNRLYGLSMDEAQAAAFLERVRVPRDPIRTSEDAVLNAVGPELCDKFFRHYTRKQWGLELDQLSAGVAARIPHPRERRRPLLHGPLPGHAGEWLHRNVRPPARPPRHRGADRGGLRRRARVLAARPHRVHRPGRRLLPLPAWGALPYRSLRFEHEHLPQTPQLLPVGTVNHPNEHAYTRVHRVQAPHRADPPRQLDRPRVPLCRRRSLLPHPLRRTTRRSTSATPSWPRPSRAPCSSAAWRSTATNNMDQVVAAALHACEPWLAGVPARA